MFDLMFQMMVLSQPSKWLNKMLL